MSGSRPLPEVVTRSTGIGCVRSGDPLCNSSTDETTRSFSTGFVGPTFEPEERLELYAGEVAEGLPQKYFSDENGLTN